MAKASVRYGMGFTLIELVVSMSIAAIFLAMAAPAMSQFLTENRIQLASNDLGMALLEARTGAMRMGMPVTVCASTGVASGGVAQCDSRNWSDGWITYVDFNHDGHPLASGVLSVHAALPSSLYISQSPAGISGFEYLPAGQVQLLGTVQGGVASVFICDVRNAPSAIAQQLSLLPNGRPRRLRLENCP